jgi:hypothetical protein
MGVTSQRLHRRKLAEAQGRAASPAASSLPPFIPRAQHERAVSDARRGYVPASALERANAELVALRQHVAEIEASNAKLAAGVTTEIEQANAEGGTAGGEQPPAETSEDEQPKARSGKGSRK